MFVWDNQAALHIVEERAQHVEMDSHFIQGKVTSKIYLYREYVRSEDHG